MLIAVKEGITVFRGGTIFEVEGSKEYPRADGSLEERLQLPDDGMGRPLLLDKNDVLVCGDIELKNAEPGHGRCYYSKEEIIGPSGNTYTYDFGPRSISFEKDKDEWRLIWRIPPIDNLGRNCSVVNKVTLDTYTLEAKCLEIDYDEFSISAIDYKQTVRKRRALHHAWSMDTLKPGFYTAEIDLGNNFKGRVHFIKHFDIQLSNKDPRETPEIVETAFSEELWNAALKLKLAWGPKSRIPFQLRVIEMFPELIWAQANYLERMCNETLAFVWTIYEREADGLISLAEAKDELVKLHPWINEDLHSQLKVLGEYYGKLKR